MKTNTLGRFLSILVAGFAMLGSPSASHASTPAPAEVVPLGENTFSITRTAKTAFSRDTDKLKAQVEEDAAKYCAAQGKQLKIVDVVSDKPFFSTGYPSAKIVFKATNPGEVEQPAPAAAPGIAAPSSTSGSFERPTPTGDLYNELTKLDELRQKGILTDKEFKAEKKKVLSRSR